MNSAGFLSGKFLLRLVFVLRLGFVLDLGYVGTGFLGAVGEVFVVDWAFLVGKALGRGESQY